MWIGYLKDRQQLGFSCIKDIDSVEQLLDFTSTLKNSLFYIGQKSNKTFIFIFSKEMIVAIFIFLESSYIEVNVDYRSFSSSEVCQSCVIKSETSGFLSSPLYIQDYILKSRGGSDELTSKEQKITSPLYIQDYILKSRGGSVELTSKEQKSDSKEISINKFLKKILKFIENFNEIIRKILKFIENFNEIIINKY